MLQPIVAENDLFNKIQWKMIILVKLTLTLLWFVAFLITCLVMSVAHPLLVLFEKVRSFT
jgi:hypothetical protein